MSDLTHVFNSTGPIGALWAEDNRLFFAPVDLEEPTTKHLASLVETSNDMRAPADLAQPVVLDRLRYVDPSVYSQTSIVASVDPETFEYVEKSPYTLTFDDDDTPIGLVFTDNGQVSVREDGEWVELLPEDPRFYGNEFHFVTENAVDLFDRLVQEDSPLTSDAFSEVYV
jgi:hypothetical protein